MGGIFSADIKKLFKGKVLIVCMVIAVIFGAVMAAVYNYAWVENEENIMMTKALFTRFGMDESLLEETLSYIPKSNLWSYFVTMLSDGSIIYFAAVCVCIYIASEFTMGTFKNTVARGFSRMEVYCSKLLSSGIAVFLVTLAYCVGGCGMALTLVKDTAEVEFLTVFWVILIYFILLLALTAFYAMLAVIFDRTGIAVAAAIVIPILINALISMASVANKDITKVNQYVLINMFLNVEANCKNGDGWILLIVGLIYLAVCSLAGFLVFSKKEIK